MANVKHDVDKLIEEPLHSIHLHPEAFQVIEKAIEKPASPTERLRTLVAKSKVVDDIAGR